MSYQGARAFDPLYGAIHFSDFELSLIQLPELQRLRYVRMCNINSMLITGASEISRFEHCLGVLHLAKIWADTNALGVEERRDFVAAALLHDLQTGPFGHSFQYIMEENEFSDRFLHDDLAHGYRSRYHQDLLATSSFAGGPFEAHKVFSDRWAKISDLIRGKGPLGPLVSGSIDLDNIDNVIRLAYHVGIADKSDATMAIDLVRDIEPYGKLIRVSRESIGRVRRWQSIRRRLYELLLLDWAEFSAKAMLTRALEHAVEAKLVEPKHWLLTDDELLRQLEDNVIGDLQDIRELTRRLRRGDLFAPVLLSRSKKTKEYLSLSQVKSKREMEAQVASSLRKKLGLSTPVLVHFILDNRKTDRSIRVHLRETGQESVVGEDSLALLVGVFVSVRPLKSVNNAIGDAVKEVLGAHGLDDLEEIIDPIDSTTASLTSPQLKLI